MKKCEWCGSEFKGKRPEQRFCDADCSGKWTAKNRRNYSGENNPNFGKKHTENTKEMIRSKAIGREVSEETRNKLSALRTGKPKTEQWKINISMALKGNPKLSKNNSKEYNPNFKHGDFVEERVYRKLVDLSKCSKCGADNTVIDVHHKDGNHFNNATENLQVLCHTCHSKLHGRPVGIKERKPRARRKLSILR